MAIHSSAPPYCAPTRGPSSHSPPATEAPARVRPGPIIAVQWRPVQTGGAGSSPTLHAGIRADPRWTCDAPAAAGVDGGEACQPRWMRGRRSGSGSVCRSTSRADRRGVALAEGEELQQVGDRVAFGPAEVGVRHLAGAIADVQQQAGDGVRAPPGCGSAARGTGRSRRRAPSSTSLNSEASPVATSRNSTGSHGFSWCVSRASRILAAYSATSPMSGRLAMMRTWPVVAAWSMNSCRRLRRRRRRWMRSSVDRSTREMSDDDDDRDDEDRGDLDAFRPLDDVRDRRVDEDERDRQRSPATQPLVLCAASVTASAADVISTSTPVA